MTGRGRYWISQFAEADQSIAALLIDSLEIHDHAEIMKSIGEQVRGLVNSNPENTPVALVPIRSIEDLPELADGRLEHVAYQTFDPGASYPSLPGSEAEIGGLIRGLIDGDRSNLLSPEASLSQLRAVKARKFCLITDYSGSGKQASRFARTFKSNTTIASWISYRLMEINVVTYAASLEASEIFQNDRHVNFQTQIFAKSARSADWSASQRQRINQLCQDYANEDEQYPALGYGDSFGLYLTNLRVPNNLPQILIRAKGHHPGLFAGREVPNDFFNELRSYNPSPSLDRTLRNLGAEDLADHLEAETRPVRGLRALAALHLLDYGMSEEHVYAMLGVSASKLIDLKTSLIALGCISLDGRLTKRGKAELQHARRKGLARPKYRHKPAPPVPYEPTQLR